jgi:succinate dehydrogenase / fumarate reductase membrane anchor subunit
MIQKNLHPLSSSKSGSKHWWAQRLTAIAMVFLTTWFVLSILKICLGGSAEVLMEIISSPFNVVMFCLFMFVSLYHGNLGMQVVIEDYVHCEGSKYFLIIFLKFISIFSFLLFLTAVAAFYFSAFV